MNDEEEILREVCLSNGLSYSRLKQDGMSCLSLEMFFSGYPRMVGLENFPNLQSLCIVGQLISQIDGLTCLTKLKDLWIVECQLQSISGLEELHTLRRLFLYSNCIKKIENLDHLSDLQTLHLNGNKIKIIEGLSELKQLKELNLAENRIELIGNSLNSLQQLETLELSGNRIYSLKDLTNLSRLKSLRTLGLKSSIYPASPVGLLCNYAIHVIYHLPQLTCLDDSEIDGKTIRDLMETTVNRKKVFYNMKKKTVEHNLVELLKKLTVAKKQLSQTTNNRLRRLHCLIREMRRQMEEAESMNTTEEVLVAGDESDPDAKNDEVRVFVRRLALAAMVVKSEEIIRPKLTILKEKVENNEKRLAEVEHFYEEAKENAEHFTSEVIHWLELELETVGNIRVDYGKPSDPWFSACQDLLLSRFCSKDYKPYNITGFQINRILRVTNHVLRSRFENALQSYVDDDDSYLPSAKQNAYKKNMEYLFWVCDPELSGGVNDPTRILEEGFLTSDVYEQLGKDAAVPLTNSICLADRLRIKHSVQQNVGREYIEVCPFQKGRIVIARVYLGKSVQTASKERIVRSAYLEADSVFRLRRDMPSETKIRSALSSGDGAQCECINRQCEWFVFDQELVLPEYIVDFEYTSWVTPRSPFHSLLENLLTDPAKDFQSLVPNDLFARDEDDELVSHMAREIRMRPRMTVVSDEQFLKCTKAASLDNITILCLHDDGLTKLKPLQSLVMLRKLIISFNELTRLDEIANMKIEYLDASFNKIMSVDGLKNMSKLKHLNLSWNRLQNTRDDISFLRKHAPVLSQLDLRHNPWQKPEGLRLRAIGRLKSLTRMNGVDVSESERAAAFRLAAGSRILQLSLLTHSRMDQVVPRTFHLHPTAKILEHHSRLKPDKLDQHNHLWMSKVTSLCIDSQHISNLSGLERLENLRWASFCDNDITKIEGLERCLKLEELSLEYNCIKRIEGVSHLRSLRRLALGHNFISTLEGSGLKLLVQLQYLSLEANCISSLAGLQNVGALSDLFLADNQIEIIREIFNLKNLPSLKILDLDGNPVSSTIDNYRLYVIYHLKVLKALDGIPIELWESSQAKDLFGGRLTLDLVAERHGHSNFNEIREMDFTQCGLQTVDLGDRLQFQNLRSLNLEHNNLTSFGGLIFLVNLRVLCLNHNHVESIIPKPKSTLSLAKSKSTTTTTTSSQQPNGITNPDAYSSILEHLEVLHLGYNGIRDLAQLQLNRLPSLKALFLQGNEISKIEGLENLKNLLELVLDRNKVKNIGEFSFTSQQRLQELHLEENRLRSLTNIGCLESIQRLYLGLNRIQDIAELEKLEPLSKLVEISLASNAVAKRHMHRPTLVFHMPNLKNIDGIIVTEDERTKAQLYFVDQQQPPLISGLDTLPGITQFKGPVPVRVTNVQLMSPYVIDKSWAGVTNLADDSGTPGGIGRKMRGSNGRSDQLQGPQQLYSRPNNGLYYSQTNPHALGGNARTQ